MNLHNKLIRWVFSRPAPECGPQLAIGARPRAQFNVHVELQTHGDTLRPVVTKLEWENHGGLNAALTLECTSGATPEMMRTLALALGEMADELEDRIHEQHVRFGDKALVVEDFRVEEEVTSGMAKQ